MSKLEKDINELPLPTNPSPEEINSAHLKFINKLQNGTVPSLKTKRKLPHQTLTLATILTFSLAALTLSPLTPPLQEYDIVSRTENTNTPTLIGSTRSDAQQEKIASMPYYFYNERNHFINKITAAPNAPSKRGYTFTSISQKDLQTQTDLLAKIFKLTAEPIKDEYGSTTITDQLGAALYIYSQPNALTSWNYYNQSLDPWSSCYSRDASSTSSSNPGQEQIPNPAPLCQPDLNLPSNDKAYSVAKEILSQITQTPLRYQIQRDQYQVQVNAYPILDQSINQSILYSVTVTEKGLLSAQGMLLAQPTELEYKIISPNEAIERANDSRFLASPYYDQDTTNQDLITTTDPNQSPSNQNTATNLIPYPIATHIITTATLTHTTIYHMDKILILPAYKLISEKNSFIVLAVDQSYLDTNPIQTFSPMIKSMPSNK